MKLSPCFAIQLDESTDISGEVQLLAYIRYATADNIEENILFCKSLPGKTTREAIFDCLNTFFQKKYLGLDKMCRGLY